MPGAATLLRGIGAREARGQEARLSLQMRSVSLQHGYRKHRVKLFARLFYFLRFFWK